MELYRRCGVVPVTERVRKARWKLLGHILRSDDNTPAALALQFAISSSEQLRGRCGRPRCNLFTAIVNDLKENSLRLTESSDLDNLKMLASDRPVWRSMFVDKDIEIS